MGSFHPFIDEPAVRLIGAEAGGEGLAGGRLQRIGDPFVERDGHAAVDGGRRLQFDVGLADTPDGQRSRRAARATSTASAIGASPSPCSTMSAAAWLACAAAAGEIETCASASAAASFSPSPTISVLCP